VVVLDGALLGMALAATEAWAGNLEILYLERLDTDLHSEPIIGFGMQAVIEAGVCIGCWRFELVADAAATIVY
jgi:hypothetical protein